MANKAIRKLEQLIKNYDHKKHVGDNITLKGMQDDYVRMKEVFGNISATELKLLWYLRNLPYGESHRFFRIAKSLYDNYLELCNLSK